MLCSGFANGCHERFHSNVKRWQPVFLELLRQQYEERRFITVAQAAAALLVIPEDNATAAETLLSDEDWKQAEGAHERFKALSETKPQV